MNTMIQHGTQNEGSVLLYMPNIFNFRNNDLYKRENGSVPNFV